MHQLDFEAFTGVLRKLSAVYGKKLEDDILQSYWDALKDRPLRSVEEIANQHVRQSKFFPKPVELRPKIEMGSSGKVDKSDRRAIARLEDLRRNNPEAWMQAMHNHDPDSSALQFAKQHGVSNIWFDADSACWKLSQ